jgi:uncharacterized repeat protein (TIGR03803 family)
MGALALDMRGNLYGTTENGWGTVFKITSSGALSTLYSFCGSACGDQGVPYSGVVRGADGNFYGVLAAGGVNSNPSLCGSSPDGGKTCGAAYRVTPQGAFSLIYSFCSQPNCADGSVPIGQLISGSDGNLYGTTMEGGANPPSGTVFKLTLNGNLTVLHSFNGADGGDCFPCAPLVQANNGNLYGTTQYGGANGAGTFFEITPAGTFTTLYSFCSQANCADGANPYGFGQGTDGNFYGTTNPQVSGCGTLFEITAQGKLTTLHGFNGADGCYPTGLVQHTNGSFYGETTGGGANGCAFGGCGTLFSLSVGLKPFVRILESTGKVGSTVQILGDNLSTATMLTFNGSAAPFTIHSGTLISATVPDGATTGWVEVGTPSGTLRSSTIYLIR